MGKTQLSKSPPLEGEPSRRHAKSRLEILLRWTSPGDVLTLTLRVSSWDFYFLIAFVLGLYALHRLALVKEEGEGSQDAPPGLSPMAVQTHRAMATDSISMAIVRQARRKAWRPMIPSSALR